MAENFYNPPKACEPGAREPDVSIAASRMTGAIERLEETVALMEGRLAPVLGPESSTGAGGADNIGNCAVSGAMYTQAIRTDYVTARLRDLLDRLEI